MTASCPALILVWNCGALPNLKPRPGNFTKDAVQLQTDGAIYWKMTEGRAPMASYKTALTEQQRWQLVNYIRQLGGK